MRNLLASMIVTATVCTSVHADPQAKPRVLVTVAADDGVAEKMIGVVRELLGRLPVDVVIERVDAIDPRTVIIPPASFDPAAARVWIDLRAGQVARVYLADGAWERVLVRSVPLPSGPDEIAREQIGHIVEGAVEALLSGATIGVTREEAGETLGVPKPTPKPSMPAIVPTKPTVRTPPSAIAPRSPTETPFRVALAVSWESLAWASGRATHGLGAWLGVARGAAFATLGLQARLPVIVDSEPVGVRVDAVPIRAMIGVGLGTTPRVRLGVGGGFDVLRVEPRSTGAAGTEVEPARTTIAPILRASLVLDARFARRAAAFVGFVAEAELSPRTYVVAVDGSERTIVTPFPLRPGLTLGIASDLL